VDAELGHTHPEKLMEDLLTTLEIRRAAFHYLWKSQQWDSFLVVITGTDRLNHFLWDAGEEPGAAKLALLWVLDLLPGLISLRVIVLAALFFVLSVVGFVVAFIMLQYGVVFTAFAAGGGGVLLYWTAWCWLLFGEVVVPVEAMSEFQGRHWMVLALVTFVPMGILIWLMAAAQQAAEAGGR
jgi:hypothetical protein